MRMRAAAAVIAMLLLSGCSGDPAATTAEPMPTPESSAPVSPPSEPASKPTPSPSAAEDETTVVDVTISGNKITPNGERVEVAVGEPVIFSVTSDRAGEFHVHATPEQTPAFTKGTSRIKLVIDKPGLVDVEEHESGMVIAQLEVR